jgi:hypothetical protein
MTQNPAEQAPVAWAVNSPEPCPYFYDALRALEVTRTTAAAIVQRRLSRRICELLHCGGMDFD